MISPSTQRLFSVTTTNTNKISKTGSLSLAFLAAH